MDKKEKSLPSTNINWYPGHMAKTKRQITEDLKLIDFVIEIMDARIPISSRNPDINKIIEKKPRILILNKMDLADDSATNQWISFFNKQGIPAIKIDANTGKGIPQVIETIEKTMQEQRIEYAEKGRVGRSLRGMIIGIPNVGKSSFINRVAKRAVTEVGNKPGVTKSKQWIRMKENIELMDTPGVLWPKLDTQKVALHLAFTGTIKDDILPKEEVAYYLLKHLLKKERDKVVTRYGISEKVIEEILEQDRPENENIYEILLAIGKRRGAVISGGNIDEIKTAGILLEDFRSGKLGRMSLEKVE